MSATNPISLKLGKPFFYLLMILMAGFAYAEEVHVYFWTDYIGEHTVENFEKKTGIKVVFDVFDSYETAEAKLLSGNSGYDVVMMGDTYLVRQAKAGVWLPLDKSKLPNWKNIDPTVLTKVTRFDPGNTYAQPYSWYALGIGYNVEEMKKRYTGKLDSWSLYFDEENIKKFADCGVLSTDEYSDLFFSAMVYYGYDPFSNKKEDYETMFNKVMPIRQYIKTFTNEYYDKLGDGSACLSNSWSGDTASMFGYTSKGVTLDFFIPKEGSYLDYDMVGIPADAKNVDAAHKFLDYLLDEHEEASFTGYIKYPNPIPASLKYVDPELIKSGKVFYPTEEQYKKFFIYPAVEDREIDRIQTRLWTKFKTGV